MSVPELLQLLPPLYPQPWARVKPHYQPSARKSSENAPFSLRENVVVQWAGAVDLLDQLFFAFRHLVCHVSFRTLAGQKK